MRSVTGPVLHPRPGAPRLVDTHPGAWWPSGYDRESRFIDDLEIQTIKNISSWVFQGVMS